MSTGQLRISSTIEMLKSNKPAIKLLREAARVLWRPPECFQMSSLLLQAASVCVEALRVLSSEVNREIAMNVLIE